MSAVAAHREALARRLFEEHRESGGAYWHELELHERDQWIRVARHIESQTSSYVGEAIARPSR